jgi:hypothetical protein
MAKGFHVVKFVHVDFNAQWTRSLLPNAVISYKALEDDARVSVVREGATGVMATYHYMVLKDQEALVVNYVIHVPARCFKEDKGITVKCVG